MVRSFVKSRQTHNTERATEQKWLTIIFFNTQPGLLRSRWQTNKHIYS